MSGAARLGCVLPTCLFPAHMIPWDRLTAFLGPTVGSGGRSGTGMVTLEAPPSSAAATLAWVSMACVTLHRKRGEWLNSTMRKSRFQSFNPMKVIPGYLWMLWEEKEEECVRPPSRQPGRQRPRGDQAPTCGQGRAGAPRRGGQDEVVGVPVSGSEAVSVSTIRGWPPPLYGQSLNQGPGPPSRSSVCWTHGLSQGGKGQDRG